TARGTRARCLLLPTITHTDFSELSKRNGPNSVSSDIFVSKPTLFYVNDAAAGSNNGLDWTNAYTDFQSALNLAVSGDTIVVAAGVYRPSVAVALNGTGNEETFLIPNGVKVFGGFAGSEDVRLQASYDSRDFVTNQTILDGDLANNDGGAPTVNTAVQPLTINFGANRADNALHVVAVPDATAEVTIDGFTIQNGHDPDATPNQYGGGIYYNATAGNTTNLLVNNCVIRWNRADRGAAIGTFEGDAGATLNLTVLNTDIYQNSGYNYGAFHVQTGAGIPANTKFVNTRFYENRTDFDGAAIMYISNEGTLEIINSLFYENDANRTYGGIAFSPLTATNAHLSIINSTIANNYGNNSQSGGLVVNNATTQTVRNSIFYGNSINLASDIQIRVFSGTLDINNSLVQDGAAKISGSSNFASGSNLSVDPLFADPSTGDFSIPNTSPAANFGDVAALPSDDFDLDGDLDTAEALPVDLAGNQREVGVVDLGAFENQTAPPTVTVLTPNGGESLTEGVPYDITWDYTGFPDTEFIEIRLSTDGGSNYSILNDGTFATYPTNTYSWTPTGAQASTDALIQIANTTQSVTDESDAVFTIDAAPAPTITVLTPNGGESLTEGVAYDITWSYANFPDTDLIEIRLSTDGGSSYSILNDGNFST
ncbi:MAG: hypothetical protein HRT61_17725, partial [Ekhidna sp.]|nr:hypothetical protein [Ekhidna sp.]